MNEDELLAGYVLGDLDPQEQQTFMTLLEERPELNQEVDRLRETLGLLPYALPEPEPPLRLKTAILKASGQTAVKRPATVPWLSLAASLVALILGVDGYRLRQDLATTQTQLVQQAALTQMLQTSGTRLVAFKPMDKQMTTSGSMVVTPGDKEAVLVLQAVAPPPPQKVYRLWAVIKGKKQVCGEFSPNAQGEVWVKVPVDEVLAQVPLIVTLEELDAPMEATGPMILTSQI